MTQFAAFLDVANEITAMFYRSELPDTVYEAVKDKVGSSKPAIPLLAAAAEATYAYRVSADMTPAMLDAAASAALFLADHSQFGMGDNQRGEHIALLLRGGVLPEGAEAPAVAPEYAQPAYVPIFTPAITESDILDTMPTDIDPVPSDGTAED